MAVWLVYLAVSLVLVYGAPPHWQYALLAMTQPASRPFAVLLATTLLLVPASAALEAQTFARQRRAG